LDEGLGRRIDLFCKVWSLDELMFFLWKFGFREKFKKCAYCFSPYRYDGYLALNVYLLAGGTLLKAMADFCLFFLWFGSGRNKRWLVMFSSGYIFFFFWEIGNSPKCQLVPRSPKTELDTFRLRENRPYILWLRGKVQENKNRGNFKKAGKAFSCNPLGSFASPNSGVARSHTQTIPTLEIGRGTWLAWFIS
jgi:hypothetical protein